eukprot:3307761-Amphidinium_carterae.1
MANALRWIHKRSKHQLLLASAWCLGLFCHMAATKRAVAQPSSKPRRHQLNPIFTTHEQRLFLAATFAAHCLNAAKDPQAVPLCLQPVGSRIACKVSFSSQRSQNLLEGAFTVLPQADLI